MKNLKKIGALSVGYALDIAYALIGLFVGILMFLSLRVVDPTLLTQDPASAFLANFGAWVIILAPIFYAILGFLAGIILAFVYNKIIVKIMGGIKLEIA
jgi:hypothetical protein